jgi:hypothetical protein
LVQLGWICEAGLVISSEELKNMTDIFGYQDNKKLPELDTGTHQKQSHEEVSPTFI